MYTHLYICINVLSGVGDGVVVDVSLLCLYSLILAKTRERGRILRAFGVCTEFRKLQTPSSVSTLFSGPTIAFVVGDYEYVKTHIATHIHTHSHIQYRKQKFRWSGKRQRAREKQMEQLIKIEMEIEKVVYGTNRNYDVFHSMKKRWKTVEIEIPFN